METRGIYTDHLMIPNIDVIRIIKSRDVVRERLNCPALGDPFPAPVARRLGTRHKNCD
jgi:hypothetical protein